MKEVFAACEAVVGAKIPQTVGTRRAGDPIILVSNADKARDVLGWVPHQAAIKSIVESAWVWEQTRSTK